MKPAPAILPMQLRGRGRGAVKPSSLTNRVPRSFRSMPEAETPAVFYAIVCNPNAERKAADGLKERGFSVYYPVLVKMVATAKKKQVEAERPLFPRYVFAG